MLLVSVLHALPLHLNKQLSSYSRWKDRYSGLTDCLKCGAIKMLPIDRVLINLPISRVHYVPMLAPQNHAAAVWYGVSHPDWFTPSHSHDLSVRALREFSGRPSQRRTATIDRGFDSLKGAQLEAFPHLECFEARFVPDAVLLHAPLYELHGKAARIDRCLRIQRGHHL